MDSLREALKHLLYMLFGSVMILLVFGLYVAIFVPVTQDWSYPAWIWSDWVIYVAGHVIYGTFWAVLFVSLLIRVIDRLERGNP